MERLAEAGAAGPAPAQPGINSSFPEPLLQLFSLLRVPFVQRERPKNCAKVTMSCQGTRAACPGAPARKRERLGNSIPIGSAQPLAAPRKIPEVRDGGHSPHPGLQQTQIPDARAASLEPAQENPQERHLGRSQCHCQGLLAAGAGLGLGQGRGLAWALGAAALGVVPLQPREGVEQPLSWD